MNETQLRFLGWEDPSQYSWAPLVAQLVKNLPAMQETWVRKIPWRRDRLPTPVFWPGELYELYSPWGLRESDTTKWLTHMSEMEYLFLMYVRASLVAQLIKNPPAMRETLISIPGLGRSAGEGNGYPLQYYGLENSMDCIVHGVAKSQTWLSNFHFDFLSSFLIAYSNL